MQPFLTGLIVAHAAFPVVFLSYPERQIEGVDGYIALSDCAEMGNEYILVRSGQPDALVAVADCAQKWDIEYRRQAGFIADVDVAIWRGGMWPQMAELWRVDDRERWWQRSERATQ